MSARPDPASISVVVPTFNDVRRLGDALSSVLAQTLRPAEIVVADDGSSDGTEHFVLDFAARSEGSLAVRYVRLASQSGDAAARNAGIAAAGGEWIAICDSDDLWAPTKLERQVEFVGDWSGSQRIVLLGTHGYNMNDAKKVISPAIMGPTTEAEYDAVKQRGGLFYVIHSSVLLSRADFDALGGYSTLEYGPANEFDLFCRMAERGVVINLPERLVYYRKRAGSMQLDLFWDRHQNVLRLTENQRRRAAGRAPISKEEFASQQAAAPAWTRFKRRRKVWGMFYYRAGATKIVNGRRVRGAMELLLASAMDGARLRVGIRNALQGRIPGIRARGSARLWESDQAD